MAINADKPQLWIELADRDLFSWLETGKDPSESQIARAASVVADRLCGATADPIIRNAQERRQLESIQKWLELQKYRYLSPTSIDDARHLSPGFFTFRLNVAVGSSGKQKVNVPVIKQKEIDDCRTQEERNRLGQFSTPFDLARDIVKHSLHFHGNRDICFLEPALGTGVFFGAIEAGADKERIKQASGIELDAGYSSIASELWPDAPFRVINQNFLDFTKLPENRGTFSLLCTNPPYVRHHHIPSAVKSVLQGRVRSELGLNPSGLSGLYVYFILLSHHLLAPNAVASWLIPSEFLSVNYGRVLREYLLRRVTLTHIHQFDPADVQFNDAMEELLDCLNNLKKQILINGGRTYGGGLHKLEPSELASLPMPRLPEWLQTPKQAELIFS